jgi:hypothetical protein
VAGLISDRRAHRSVGLAKKKNIVDLITICGAEASMTFFASLHALVSSPEAYSTCFGFDYALYATRVVIVPSLQDRVVVS